MEGCPAIGCIILEDPLMFDLARVELGVRREVCVAMGRTILENPLVSDCQPPALLPLGELSWEW